MSSHHCRAPRLTHSTHSYGAFHPQIEQLLSSRTNPFDKQAAAAADGHHQERDLDDPGEEAASEKGEMLLGLDVEPQIGDSVQMAVGFMANGTGHVVSVDDDGSSVHVKWKSGGTRRILTGQDGVYALALVKADASGAGADDTNETLVP